jgi:hypothetical protein
MHSLLDAGVVDQITLLVRPTSRGKGTRIFEDQQDLKPLEATLFETESSFCATGLKNRRKVRTFEESAAGARTHDPDLGALLLLGHQAQH